MSHTSSLTSEVPRSAFRRAIRTTVVVALIFAGATVLRGADTAAAVGSIDVDHVGDDTLSTCSGAANDCSLRGAMTYADAHSGTTVNVPAGTYTLTLGELAVGSASNLSTTIVGAGAATTIIDGGNVTRIFDVNPNTADNVAFSISHVTLQHGVAAAFGGGAILAGWTGNTAIIDDVTFSANSAPSPLSGAAVSFSGGGNLTVTNSRFAANTAVAGVGAAIFMNMSNNPGNLNVAGSSFTDNSAKDNGGAVYVAGNATPGNVFTITGSTFSGNTATVSGAGGAIHLASGTLNLHFNRIVGNTGAGASGLYLLGGATAVADHNWWGCNAGPGSAGCDTVGNSGTVTLVTAPRLSLRHTANPATIEITQQSTLTADFLADSVGGAVSASNLGALVGRPISFASAVLGSISSPQATIQAAGTATATFTAGSIGGLGSASATVDNQTVVAAVTVNKAPSITTQPLDPTVCVGGSVSLIAAADGFPVPTVQWQKSIDGGTTFNDVAGATNSTLTFTAAATDTGAKYRAVFTNVVNSATTNVVTLTVNTAPLVTLNPVSLSRNVGDNATFTSAASGTPAPTAQWQKSTDGGVTFNNISGATSTTLSFTVAVADLGSQYRTVFANTCGTATTSAATLSVNAQPGILTQPSAQTICAGQLVSFTATASGVPTPTVQWQQSTDGGATFNNIAGATSTTLTFTTASSQTGNQYRAVFTNSVSSATSSSALLTVNNAPLVTSNPVNLSRNIGQTATFSSAATGTPTPTAQWQKSTNNGATFTNIVGETSTTLSFTVALVDNGSQYRTVFSNTCGTATTSAATLSVNTQPAVLTQPSPQTVCDGQTVSFTATAGGAPTPTVQWQRSIDGGVSFTDIGGATSTTLNFTAVGSQNGYQYRASFTNSAGTMNSDAALLTVNIAPVISTQPTNQTAVVGTTATFTAAATGRPTPTVQWQKSTNGGSSYSDIVGATSTTLSFTAAAADDGSLYRAVFSNVCGQATTNGASLTVAAIELAPSTLPSGVKGTAYTATITASNGTAPYSFGVTAGSLPPGLTLASSGALTGTPIAVGTFSFTVTATDSAARTGSRAYTVGIAFAFSGFASPVANPPTVNGGTSGRAIPFKFSLGVDAGLNILAAGSPTSQQVNCTTKALIGSPQSAFQFSGGSLSFDATLNQYNFTWKTAKNWGGTCRVFTLKLTDGTSHIAYVSFT